MVTAETLTSENNRLLKEIRKAISRGSLTAGGLCVAETWHLLEEALGSACEVSAVLASASAPSTVENRLGGRPGIRLLRLDDDLFGRISATANNQGVMALVRPPSWRLEQVFGRRTPLLVLDGIQDPGNLGTMIRAAEAFGASGVIAIKGSANPYNPKAIRASAGSIFRLPVAVAVDAASALAAIRQRRLAVYAAMPGAGNTIDKLDLTGEAAFIIGGEGGGVSEQLRAAAIDIRIPTLGVESLNAAMAATILLYEARRQRTQGR